MPFGAADALTSFGNGYIMKLVGFFPLGMFGEWQSLLIVHIHMCSFKHYFYSSEG